MRAEERGRSGAWGEERQTRGTDPVPEQEAEPHHVVIQASSQEADKKEEEPAGGFWGRLIVPSRQRQTLWKTESTGETEGSLTQQMRQGAKDEGPNGAPADEATCTVHHPEP